MKPENFLYWLNGFVEMGGERPTEEQWKMLKEHLALTMQKITTTTISLPPQLFPNPAKANTTIRFNAVKEAKAVIELQDIHGKVFMRKEIIVNAGTNNVSVDISRYASGMYFISVVSAQEKIRLKLNKE